MNSVDLKQAKSLLKFASKINEAKQVASTLRSIGIVRCAQFYIKKGETALVAEWLKAAGHQSGNVEELGRLTRNEYLNVIRRAFAIAEALHVIAQIEKREQKNDK